MVEHATTIINGMDAICALLGRSEATVLKWSQQYDDMPVKKVDGRWESDREALIEWRRVTLLNLPPTVKEAPKQTRKRTPKNPVKPINGA